VVVPLQAEVGELLRCPAVLCCAHQTGVFTTMLHLVELGAWSPTQAVTPARLMVLPLWLMVVSEVQQQNIQTITFPHYTQTLLAWATPPPPFCRHRSGYLECQGGQGVLCSNGGTQEELCVGR